MAFHIVNNLRDKTATVYRRQEPHNHNKYRSLVKAFETSVIMYVIGDTNTAHSVCLICTCITVKGY